MSKHVDWLKEWPQQWGRIPRPKAGDVYEFANPCSFGDDLLSATPCPEGTLLVVLGSTTEDPHDYGLGPNGHNWLCHSVNGDTVWSRLEVSIATGLLKKVT